MSNKLKICWRCLKDIESREGKMLVNDVKHGIYTCDWCKEECDELYTIKKDIDKQCTK